MKILLIQIRQNESVKAEELESFIKFSGLLADSFEVLDVFKTPDFTPEILKGASAVFVGGASEASVLEPETYPFVSSIIETIKATIALEIPVFASCFGFQVAVLALGGKIIRDTNDFEMGTYEMQTTEAAANDPVFSPLPKKFYAVSVHQERAQDLPDSCILLAYTESCPHAFKVKSKPFWAFQFHPELDKACLEQRLGIYKEKYTEDADQFERVIKSLRTTEHANRLVRTFTQNILLKQKEIL